ncbi:MAG: hypothetical protein JW762_04060 [Dehalococcoidales bacterium]|nr:hypothetical protein [Dehalococcoidales bacterium]
MKKKQIIIGLSVALAISVILSSIGLAASPTLTVTINEAENVATNEIVKFKDKMAEWDTNSIPVQTNTYYTPDGEKAVYEYTVISNEKESGYILVSARKDWMPVLETSSGRSPSSFLSDVREIAIEEGHLLANDTSEPIFYFWGALTYSVQIGERMKSENTVIHLPTGRILHLPSVSPELKMDSTEAYSTWASISNENTNPISNLFNSILGNSKVQANAIYSEGEFPKALNTSKNIVGVPKFYQGKTHWGHGDDRSYFADPWPDCVGYDDDPWRDWDGCAPIAGAMVLGYWSTHGYPNIPSPYLGETEDILIDHCHKYMDTSYEGATDYDDIVGMEQVANTEYEYGFDSFYTLATWEWVLYEMYYNRPFVIAMNDYPEQGENHAVCVYGYVDEAGVANDKLHVNNTWNTDDCFITWNSWSSASITVTEPGY